MPGMAHRVPRLFSNTQGLSMTAANLFSFEGRIGRGPLWLLILVSFGIAIVVNVASFLMGGVVDDGAGSVTMTPAMVGMLGFGGIVGLVLAIINLSFQVRRCHDRNRSGWFILLWLLPILNIWGFIELYCLAGTPGPNQYGPDLSGAGFAQTGEVFR